MKSPRIKLIGFFFVIMILLSQASASFTNRARFTVKSKFFPESVKGFLVGFFFEISNAIDFHSKLMCIAQDVAFKLYDHQLEIIIEENIRNKEDYDSKTMDEYSDVVERMNNLKSIDFKFISSLQAQESIKSATDEILERLKKMKMVAELYKKRVVDFIENLTPVVEFLQNPLVKMSLDILMCYLSSDTTTPQNFKESILNQITKLISNAFDVGFIIAKLQQIPDDVILFVESFRNEATTNYERYLILGRAVASIIRIYLKAHGITLN